MRGFNAEAVQKEIQSRLIGWTEKSLLVQSEMFVKKKRGYFCMEEQLRLGGFHGSICGERSGFLWY